MGKIALADATTDDIAYYNKVRETIHGLDGVIVKVINDSVTMITGALGLSVLLYDKLSTPETKTGSGLVLVMSAFLITLNSRKRIKLYSGLLGKAVLLAKELEVKLFPEGERLTWSLEEVPRSGLKGEKLYVGSTSVFIAIELVLSLIFVWSSIPILGKLCQ